MKKLFIPLGIAIVGIAYFLQKQKAGNNSDFNIKAIDKIKQTVTFVFDNLTRTTGQNFSDFQIQSRTGGKVLTVIHFPEKNLIQFVVGVFGIEEDEVFNVYTK